MTIEVESMIKGIAKMRLGKVIDTHNPSQYDSELLKDITQDLYLEYYKIRKEMPNITDLEVEKKLYEAELSSQPDAKMVYVGASIESMAKN